MVIKGISQEQLEELKRVQRHFEGLNGKMTNVEVISNGRIDKNFKVTISFEGVGFRHFIFRTINKYVFLDSKRIMKEPERICEKISDGKKRTIPFHTIKGVQTCESTMVYCDEHTNNYWIVYDYLE